MIQVIGAATVLTLSAPFAHAEDCLLDSNDNGVADIGDTDGGAVSGGDDTRLACGVGASVSLSGAGGTALGGQAAAAGIGATALGFQTRTDGDGAVAVGRFARVTQLNGTAVGSQSRSADGELLSALMLRQRVRCRQHLASPRRRRKHYRQPPDIMLGQRVQEQSRSVTTRSLWLPRQPVSDAGSS